MASTRDPANATVSIVFAPLGENAACWIPSLILLLLLASAFFFVLATIPNLRFVELPDYVPATLRSRFRLSDMSI